MPKGYHHLTYEERCQICTLKQRGDSPSSIAKNIGVDPSTIYRELKRNSGYRGYRFKQAHKKSITRRNKVPHPNHKMSSELKADINEKLNIQWSPVQISGWLKRQEKEKFISHETIYKYIWEEKRLGGFLYKNLRHQGKKYNKRGKATAGRGMIPGRIDIEKRPQTVEEKSRLGDFELDTIIGAGQSGAIVSIVDRCSKLTMLFKISRKTADEVEKALIKRLEPVIHIVKTLTADNGKEFANHKRVSEKLVTDFYFATPYHSWERGLNEHTNGLVRQYFPKNKRFDEITQEDVKNVEILLNNRPRKVLNFETPLEVFKRLSEKPLDVALQA